MPRGSRRIALTHPWRDESGSGGVGEDEVAGLGRHSPPHRRRFPQLRGYLILIPHVGQVAEEVVAPGSRAASAPVVRKLSAILDHRRQEGRRPLQALRLPHGGHAGMKRWPVVCKIKRQSEVGATPKSEEVEASSSVWKKAAFEDMSRAHGGGSGRRGSWNGGSALGCCKALGTLGSERSLLTALDCASNSSRRVLSTFRRSRLLLEESACDDMDGRRP